LPTNATGTYQWNAVYTSGDANNNGAQDLNDPSEQVKIAPFQNITISGIKYNDLTGDGFSCDDTRLGGVTINLYQVTNGVNTLIATTMTAVDGTYSFSNLGPGTYYVQEVVPPGATQTGGCGGYTVIAQSGGNVTGENFDDFYPVAVCGGDFATIGFWQNRNGQAVINSFNGSSTSTALGTWLASNFPDLFGSANAYLSGSLAGMTNAQVATVYKSLWTPSGVTKNTYVQAFAVALGLYADNSALSGTSSDGNLASRYGFNVNNTNTTLTYNIGRNGAAFSTPTNPVSNYTSLTVYQILDIVDANFNAAAGTFFNGNQTLTSELNNVLNGINTKGDI
ncbi:MAG TPA: SdrD B-like domain-containing protein, partial [Gemmataceae bacterium]|nr:SdrD B-like domain-containing protein [Gemmataceae bacterium]